MHVRIYENLRTVSYAPFYVASACGLYAKHGLNAQTIMSPDPKETAVGLLEGRMDVSFGGPMRVMMHHNQNTNCPLVCFCQVVGPDPFVLIGNQPKEHFRFTDLVGPTVAVMEQVPTPWLTLQDDLRRAGVVPEQVNRADARSMAENVQALRDGVVDVIHVMEPFASLALANPNAYLWHECSTRGNLGFTTFYTTRGFFNDNEAVCAALVAGVMDAIEQIYTSPASDTAALLAPLFPGFSDAVLSAAVARYQRAGLWTRQPQLHASEFVKLKAALLSGGFIQRDIPFCAVVDNRGCEPD